MSAMNYAGFNGNPMMHGTHFTGDRRHVNPMLEAFLYVPPSPESIQTPRLKNKKHSRRSKTWTTKVEYQNDAASVMSNGSFASTISLLKHKFSRRAKQ